MASVETSGARRILVTVAGPGALVAWGAGWRRSEMSCTVHRSPFEPRGMTHERRTSDNTSFASLDFSAKDMA